MLILLSSCAQLKLEDRPIIKKIVVEDEIVCIYEVKFLSGEDRCIPEKEYRSKIEPYEIVMPMETFSFFKRFVLKACSMAGRKNKKRCSHEVKTLDRYVQKLNSIVRAFSY